MLSEPDDPRLLTIVTTEHFTLQTARSATTAESTGRASIYLGAASSALIALAFIGQTAGLGTIFYAFGLVILVPLILVGVVTFERTLQSGIEDAMYARRINRLRRFYFRWEALHDYLMVPVESDDVGEVMEQSGVRATSRWRPFFTVSGMIGTINSFQVGVMAGFLTRVLGGGLLLATMLTAVFFFLAIAFHLRRQMREWRRLSSTTYPL